MICDRALGKGGAGCELVVMPGRVTCAFHEIDIDLNVDEAKPVVCGVSSRVVIETFDPWARDGKDT